MFSLRSSATLRTLAPCLPQRAPLRSFATSRVAFLSPGEGMGEKKPAATDSDNPASKRGEVLKDGLKQAGQAVKEAFGGNGEEPRGDGTSGHDEGRAPHVLPRNHIEEQVDKGKAAGGVQREQHNNSN